MGEAKNIYFTCLNIQGHVHADNDGAKMGFTLWGCLDKIEGAIEASQVVENNDKQCEVGARYNIASDFFIGGKINTNKKELGLTSVTILNFSVDPKALIQWNLLGMRTKTTN